MGKKELIQVIYFLKYDINFIAKTKEEAAKESNITGFYSLITYKNYNKFSLLKKCLEDCFCFENEAMERKVCIIAFDNNDEFIGKALFECIVVIPDPELKVRLISCC